MEENQGVTSQVGFEELDAAIAAYDPTTDICDIPELGGTASDGGTPGDGEPSPSLPRGEVTTTNGVSSVTYTLPFSGATIEVDGETVTVTTAGGESEQLQGLDRITFDDGTLYLDTAPEEPVGGLLRAYDALFDRSPDEAGFDYWLDQIESGVQSYVTVVDSLVQTDEFQAAWSDVVDSASAFVGRLYERVLDRTPDAAGLEYWTDVYSDGLLNVTGMMVAFADSAEFNALVSPNFNDRFFI